MTVDQIQWIIIYVIIGFLGLIAIAACQMAGKWDDAEGNKEEMEELEDEIQKETGSN